MTMIEVSVTAIKGGYREIYRTPNLPKSISKEIRHDSGSGFALGQEAFSMFLIDEGAVFSKCRIVTDGMGGRRVGNVNFSIFIPSRKSLAGCFIKELLDKLLNSYCNSYVKENNLENVLEDWAFVNTLSKHYSDQLENRSNADDYNSKSGENEAAFIFYKDDTELLRHFDDPFREEYSSFKQVFFVDHFFEGKRENPLNALRHDPRADLTGKVELENPAYTLLFQNHSGDVQIEVKSNGKVKYNKSKVKRKDKLEITWSKKFHRTKIEVGKIDDLFPDFLSINKDDGAIEVKDFELHEERFTYLFETRDSKEREICDADILLGTNVNSFLLKKTAVKGQVDLTAEELSKKYFVYAEKDNLKSLKREITTGDAITPVILVLLEKKEVIFTIESEGKATLEFNMVIIGKESQAQDGSVDFIGDEIKKTWKIVVTLDGHEKEIFDFCPDKSSNRKTIILRRKGDSVDSVQQGTTNVEPKNPAPGIVKRKWNLKVIALVSIFIAVLMIAATYLLTPSKTSSIEREFTLEMNNRIIDYTDGIELNMDTLKLYKSICSDAINPSEGNFSERSLWEKIFPFGSKGKDMPRLESGLKSNCVKEVESAITLRRLINNGKLNHLRRISYSNEQQSFKNTVDSIEEDYISQIGDTLKKLLVSKKNLNKVADLIEKTQEDLKKVGLESQQQENETSTATPSKKKAEKKPKKDQQQSTKDSYVQAVNSLENEFWTLVRSGNDQMNEYTELLNNHKESKGVIKDFLNEICRNSKSFGTFKNIPKSDRMQARTLTDLDLK